MPAAAPALIRHSVEAFLRRHAPFNAMAERAFDFLAARLRLAYFAKDATILEPGPDPVAELYIVQRGNVASRSPSPEEPPDPTLGPGECFPVGALTAGAPSSKVFFATGDTFCYALRAQDVIELRRISPEFERFCVAALGTLVQQSLAQLQAHYAQVAAERQSLAQPLSMLIRREPVHCTAGTTLREALHAMRRAMVRSIVIVDAEREPLGLFTHTDLLDRVVLPGRSLDTPIAEVMTRPPVTVPKHASAYQALAVMAQRQVRQVLVVDGARLAGVVSERDLFSLQRVSMRRIGQAVKLGEDFETLARAAQDIRSLTQNLLAQGAAAEPLTDMIASLNDALSRKVLELVSANHDLAGISWCWLSLGSEGRHEQTASTDQDNALLFQTKMKGDSARARLLAFAGEVNHRLDELGFPLCKGGVMASNPAWCLSADEWRSRIGAWIREPTPQALLGANVFLDFRALYGEEALADELRAWLLGLTQPSQIFLRLMAQNALETTPALGVIRPFATDDDPQYPHTIDLKMRGVRLFVDAARVLALAHGVAGTGTAQRLRESGAALKVDPRYVDATIDAFHFLQMLRLRQQLAGARPAAPNRVDPDELNEIDQRMLKEAFRQARKLQNRMRQIYQL